MRCSKLLAAEGSFRGACWELELSILLPTSTLRSEEPAMCARRIGASGPRRSRNTMAPPAFSARPRLLAGSVMTGRRHLGRASAKFLSADGSLFDAMQSIIGQKLRELNDALPQEVPSDLSRLLTQLDEPQTE